MLLASYDCSFIVTVIKIVNYKHKTFIVQATGSIALYAKTVRANVFRSKVMALY
jgi:hypothetical protein